MESGAVIIFIMMINVCYKSDAKLNVIPRDTEVKINDSTYMNCSTSLRAHLVQWRHGNNYVYTAIGIIDPYNNGRFSIEINASSGASNLVIRSVQPSDGGEYECSEDDGFGETRSARLIIFDADPICKSDMHSGGVIGPNSCGLKPDDIQLSCSVKYYGNIPPILHWKTSAGNQSVTDGLSNVTFNNNEVTYTLTMKTSLDLNNASLICQTATTSERQYSCSFEAINILYIFSGEVTVNMTLNDEVSCFANTSQSCNYKWKWFSGDDISTESVIQILKPKKVGMHRCEATCSFGSKLCTVESMHAKVYSYAATKGQNRMSLLVLLLVPALGVIGVIMYCGRKRNDRNRELHEIELKREQEEKQSLLAIERKREEQEEKQRLLGLIATIRTKAADKGKTAINGLTILDQELFVVNEKSSEVEVYDSIKFSFSRQWTLKELMHPKDIASCNRSKCLYISDNKGVRGSKEILRVDPNGKLIKKWSTKRDCGQISVTYESNVILIVSYRNKLNEYSPDGLFIREINLSSKEGFSCPFHAIKLTNGDFLLSHGFCVNEQNRVCLVDGDGKLLKSFGGNCASINEQTNAPVYLSVDRNGFVIVADRDNSRVLLLDSDLKFKKEILSEKHELRYPTKILLDESNGRLFVADNELNSEENGLTDGQILIYILND